MSVNLSGKTVIKGNSGKDNHNNITLRRTWYTGTLLDDVSGLTEGSEIYVGTSKLGERGSFTDDMSKSDAERVVDYFKHETSKFHSVVAGNYGDYYLSFED